MRRSLPAVLALVAACVLAGADGQSVGLIRENPTYKVPVNTLGSSGGAINPYMQVDSDGDALPPAGVTTVEELNADLARRMNALRGAQQQQQQNLAQQRAAAMPPVADAGAPKGWANRRLQE